MFDEINDNSDFNEDDDEFSKQDIIELTIKKHKDKSITISNITFGDGRNHANKDFDRLIRDEGYQEALFQVEGVANPYAVSFNVSHDKKGADTRWYSGLRHGSTIPNREDGALHSGHHKIYISGAKYHDENPPETWALKIIPIESHKERSVTFGDGRDSLDWDVDRYGGEEYLFFKLKNVPQPEKVIFNMSHNVTGPDSRWYTGLTHQMLFKHRSPHHRIYVSGAKNYGESPKGLKQFTAEISSVKKMPTFDLNDTEKTTYLEKYAPKVWMDEHERFFPSSVEWSFPHLIRELRQGKYCLKTKEKLHSPSSTLPYFAGDLHSAPVYSFWVEKDNYNVDLIYFLYFPYNRGKEVLNTIWGNHVGDWEHITVRLTPGINNQGKPYYIPHQVYISAHDFGQKKYYQSMDLDGTHPVIYSAEGSHGLWPTAGEHTYKRIPPLSDICSAGTAWDTWKKVKSYTYDGSTKQGRSLQGEPWPNWMRHDFDKTHGDNDPADPTSGAIYRWGNHEMGRKYFGQHRLESGPTGPVSKDVWRRNVFE